MGIVTKLSGSRRDLQARSVTTVVHAGFHQIRGTRDSRESQELRGVEASRTALLSQEGSTIETAVEIVRGVVP